MKSQSQKSQITMIIIVGFVLFIIVGIIFYLSKSSIRKSSQQNIKSTESLSFDTQQIKEFVSKCQDKLAKEAIHLIGEQGGYIYKSQGGEVIDDSDSDSGMFFISYDGKKVKYNIERPSLYSMTLSNPHYSSTIPDYPWTTYPYLPSNPNEPTFDGPFGRSSLLGLNISHGPNSIQFQIESYIDNNIEKCANLIQFNDQGFEIKTSPSKTSVVTASSDVRIKTSMPIIITNKATKEQSNIDEFSTIVNVRLGELYYFVKDLINNDVYNIKFNLKDAGNSKNFFRISVVENKYLKDDIIIVTDDKSQISGKPFEYRFARKNRMPALHFIPVSYVHLQPGALITEQDILQGNSMKAEDPDEDGIVFAVFPQLPTTLNQQQMSFKITASDGQFLDYQIITVGTT